MNASPLYAGLFLVAAVTLMPPAHAAPTYTITSLGDLGSYTTDALALNNAGQVVGLAQDASGGQHLFFSSGGVMTSVAKASGYAYQVNGINDNGEILAFGKIYSADGTTKILPYMDGSYRAINNSGQVGGEAFDVHAWGDRFITYSPVSGLQKSSGPVAYDMYGTDINDTGRMVGFARWHEADDRFAPISYYNGQFQMLETGAGIGGRAEAVNNSGFAVGEVWRDGYYRAAMWTPDGKLVDLGAMLDPDISSMALNINSTGEVVGYSQSGAFLYSGGVMYNLNDLTSDAIWMDKAIAINDQHQILAQSWWDNHGVLLSLGSPISPVPEPLGWAMLLPGLFMFGTMRWRKRAS
jgi:probable HAF family extracellular repeat protein